MAIEVALKKFESKFIQEGEVKIALAGYRVRLRNAAKGDGKFLIVSDPADPDMSTTIPAQGAVGDDKNPLGNCFIVRQRTSGQLVCVVSNDANGEDLADVTF